MHNGAPGCAPGWRGNRSDNGELHYERATAMNVQSGGAHSTTCGIPLAYHFTFATYGTRLHGEDAPRVDCMHNEYGKAFLPANPARRQLAQQRMKHDAVCLSDEQRRHVEANMAAICKRGGWELHTHAAGRDHIHVLLSTAREPYKVRNWLKTWVGQSLSPKWPLVEGARWWAVGGSIKHVWDRAYFQEAYEYIARQRFTVGG